MKITLLVIMLVLLAGGLVYGQGTTVVSPGNKESYSLAEVGTHQRVWERIEYEPTPDGRQKAVVHRYAEMETGMNYWENGRWNETKEEIEIVADHAIAAQGGHKVIFAGDIATAEVIDLQTPDGKRLRSRIFGLSYFDTATGKAALIAEVKSSEGKVLPPNHVIYFDAFDDVNADVEYIYTKAGFEQNIILRSQLPLPGEFGLDPATTRLQVLTEFIDPPVPAKAQDPRANGLTDEYLDFGEMKMGRGLGFSVGDEVESQPVPIIKRWTIMEGRTFLVEEIPFVFVDDQINGLISKGRGASLNPQRQGTGTNVIAALKSILPKRLAQAPKSKARMARLDRYQPKGFVLDYSITMASDTNFTFKSDTTHYVSGTVNLSGTTTFEGGAVVKYAVATSATVIASNAVWQSDSYRPVIFTSKNDDSVGEPVSGSSGNPTTSFAGNIALNLGAQTAPLLSHVKFSYLSNAINASSVTLLNAQLIQCYSVFASTADTFHLRNVLGYKLGTLQKQTCGACTPAVLTAENVTLHFVTNLVSAITNASISLTNCLFVQVTNLQPATVITNSSYILASDTGVFQTVNGGAHYLASNTYRDVGTTSINADLLAGLKLKTTYPPIAYTNTSLTTSTALGPQATRDTNNAPDIGYHYDPLDYLFGKVDLNTNLTFAAGTAVGWFRYDSGWTHAGHGIHIADSKILNFVGLADAPCWYVHQTTVQEQLVGYTPYDAGAGGITGWATSKATQPFLNLQFTHFAGLPIYRNHTRDDSGALLVTANHCEFHGGGVGGYVSSLAFTNCLLDRVGFWLDSGNTNYNEYFALRNCTVRGGYFSIARQAPNIGRIKVTILDSVFDDSVVTTSDAYSADATLTKYDYNAFRTNTAWLNPTGAHAVIVSNSSFNWQWGRLGNFYVPTNSPLRNVGSVSNAGSVGLYHFTITTNLVNGSEIKETNSIVDLGYHHLVLATNGSPADTDGDGTPDYLEDANGNGVVDSGETLWGLAILTQPQSQSIAAGSSVTFTVGAAGVPTIGYQWKFNVTNVIAGATSSSLTLNPVSPTNAGNYTVVVTNSVGAITSTVAVLTVTCSSPPSGLVGWWQAESNALDSAGTYHGVSVGSSYTNGYLGKAFQFDGTNNYIRIPDAPALKPTNLTIEAWVRFDSLSSSVSGAPAGFQFIVFKQNSRSTYFEGYALTKYRSGSSDYFSFGVSSSTGIYKEATNTTAIAVNTWYHVAGVRGSNYIQLFVNGQLKQQTTVSLPQDYGSTPLFFGSSGQSSFDGKLRGKLDEVSIYDRVLTTNEIAAIYLAGTLGKCPTSPRIVPANSSALLGVNGGLTAVGGGTPPLGYQWQFSSSNIPDATNGILPLTNLPFTNSGTYTVFVTNSGGTVSTNTTMNVQSCFSALDVMLVIDHSGSMSSNLAGTTTTNRLLGAKIASSNLVANLNTNLDQCGLVYFSDYPATKSLVLTNWLLSWQQAIQGVPSPSGNTYMSDTLMIAQEELTSSRHHTNALPVIVFLSDGIPTDVTGSTTASSNLVMSVADQVKRAGTVLITVALSSPGDSDFAQTTNFMRTLASSPSFAYVATNFNQLTNVYDQIATNICRGSDPSNQPPAVSWVSPANNQLFITSPTNILLWANNTGGVMTEMLFYKDSDLVPLGRTNAAPYQILWTNVTAGTYTLKAVGTNSGSHVSVSANITNVFVNAMPVVTITTPTQLQSGLKEVTNVTLWAGAYDPDGPIQQVRFYTNLLSTNYLVGVRDGMTTNYSALWSGLLADSYSITAVAIDTNNASSISTNRVFQVQPTNAPPKVWITYPTNNEVFRAGADITMTAEVSPGAGEVTTVEFFVNGNSLGSDSETPYSITECCWQPGTYTLVAKAVDNLGATEISTNLTMVVAPQMSTSVNGYWDYSFYPTEPKYPIAVNQAHAFAWASDQAGNVFLGGDFFRPYSLEDFDFAYQILMWDGAEWSFILSESDTNIEAFGGIYSLSFFEGILYAGGSANYGGFVARRDGTNWSEVGNGLLSTNEFPIGVAAMAFVGSDLYVVGDFVGAGYGTNLDMGVQYVARLVGTNWVRVGNDLTMPEGGAVWTIKSVGDTIYIGGDFTAVDGNTNIHHIAKLDGNTWMNLAGGVNDTVRTLAACGDDLYVGGDFTTANGDTNANCIAKWDGKYWSTLGRGVSGGEDDWIWPLTAYPMHLPTVRTISIHGGDLYVGGEFRTGFDGDTPVALNHIAKVSWDEGLQKWSWSSLDGGIDPEDEGENYVLASMIVEGQNEGQFDLYVAGIIEGMVGGFNPPAPSGYVPAARWRSGYPAGANAPTTTITAPASYSIFNDPAFITIQASVTEGDAAISMVHFFVDGQLIGSSSSSPYSYEWYPPQPPTNSRPHWATVVAVDTNGLQGRSSPVFFTVNATNGMSDEVILHDDVFTVFADFSPVNLPVLTNDAPANGLRINAAGQWGFTLGGTSGLGNVAVGHDGTYLVFTPQPHRFGTNLLMYSATNASGMDGNASVQVFIRSRPQIEILSPDCSLCSYTSPVSNLIISGSAVDRDGTIASVTLLTNGSPYGSPIIPTGTNFSFTWSTTTAGFYKFVAVATDNEGYTNASLPARIRVQAASSPNPPIAAITSPVAIVAGLGGYTIAETYSVHDGYITNLIGTARDPDGDPVSYQVLLLDPQKPAGEPLYNITPEPLDAQGFYHGAVTNGSLGILDLSAVENGTYLLTLVVHGGGDEATANLVIAVDSNLKIGQFSFSEQDLVLPVNGIPITVTRTYNSMNPRSADFGYSWTYALNSMDVQLDESRQDVTIGSDALSLDPFEEDRPGLPRKISIRTGGSRDVTLTLPDGRRTTFNFKPKIHSADMYAEALWEAPRGVTETLSNLTDSGIIYLPWASPPSWASGGWNSTFENHDLNGWKLTTLDGTEYLIRRGEGEVVLWDDSGDGSGHFIPVTTYNAQPKLEWIVQRSGDKIHITDTGLTHYDKSNAVTRSMFMQRDSVGRVVAIFDPNSGVTDDASALNAKALVKYIYNRDTGNLIQVHRLQDRTAGNYLVTKYHYDHPKFPHFITSIEDPRGIPLARNEYDDDGRLTAVVDADGKRTEFGHDTNGRFERVIDRGGGTNTYVYDTKGNVIFTTNAIGVVMAMTNANPDVPNAETAVTNALGTTQMTWALYAYNEKGYKTNVVTSPDHTNSFRYDDYGNLLWQRDPVGNITTNGYDGFGNLTNTIQLDAGGNPIGGSSSLYDNGHLIATLNYEGKTNSSFTYDASGNLTDTMDASGVTRHFGYNANGNQTNSWYVWTNGVSTIYVTNRTEYDAQGRAKQTIDPLGNTNSTFYNSLGKVDYTVDRFGNTNSFLYDTRGNLIRTTDAQGLTNYTVFDDTGRAFFTQDRNGITGTHSYFDAAGRATNVVRVTNAVVMIDAGPRSVLAFGGYPISTNSTEYFDSGWVKSRTGPDGAKTTYAYWPDGQTMYVTNVFATNVIFYKYDMAGRQEYVADALNHTNRFEYDAAGRMFKTTFHDGTYTSNYFNGLGQRTVVRDQAGLLTQFGYDVSGQLTNVIKPGVIDPEDSYHTNSPIWSYTYDAYGRLTVTTDPKLRSTTNSYDAFGREVAHWLTTGGAGETNYYNSLGQLTNRTDFKGQKRTFKYDRFGRVATNNFFDVGATYPSNSVSYYYNTLGQLTNITERFGTDASSTYVASVSPPGGRGRFAALIAFVNRVPPGVQGGLLGLNLGLGLALVGLTAEARRRRMRTWEFILTIAATLRVRVLSLSASTGERAGVRCRIPLPSAILQLPPSMIALCSYAIYVLRCGGTPDGTPKRFRLPSFGWRFATLITLLALIGCDPALDGLWTARAACVDPGSTGSTLTTRITFFSYDVEGRLSQVNSPEGYINYEYDLATGRQTRTCTLNSEFTDQFDALGRLWKVNVLKRNGTNITTETTTYTYTAVGSRATVTLPSGVVTSYQYDELNRLTNLVNKAGGTTMVSQFSYQLHPTGRRTNAVEILKQEDGNWQTNTLSWAFDGMYRLTNEVCVSSVTGASYTNRYQYDKTGNRWSKVLVASAGTTTITNLYNANDQLLKEVTLVGGSPTATNTYLYDANGSVIAKTNMVSGGSTNLYTYDLKNKLSSVAAYNGSWTTNSFQYNEQGIRVRTITGASTKYFLVDANNHTGYAQVLEELSAVGGTPTKSYVLGDDVLAQATTTASYLLYDGHGSTRQVSSNTGIITSRYNYDAYGTKLGTSTSSAQTDFLYCGEQYDSTLNMYNLRARYYNPATGTFNARDSFIGNNEDPQSLHKYGYAHCDPVNGVDPTGNWTYIDTLVVATVIGLTAGMCVGSYVAARNGLHSNSWAYWKVTLSFGAHGAVLGFMAGCGIIAIGATISAARNVSNAPSPAAVQGIQAEAQAIIPEARVATQTAMQETSGFTQGGLELREFEQARRFANLEGWRNFTGAPNGSQPAFDGAAAGRLIQLKEVTSANPAAIMNHAQHTFDVATREGYKGIEMCVEARNITQEALHNFIAQGQQGSGLVGLVQRNSEVVTKIVVVCQDGVSVVYKAQ